MALSADAKTIVFVVLGATMALMGAVSYGMFPRILQWQVEENLILSPEAEPYEYWKVVPVPIYARFYFFNITNTKDVLEINAKPHLEELGPYTFRETREKVNITWHENGTVSYHQIKRWFYEPNLTNGTLDDLVTNVNVPLAFPKILIVQILAKKEQFLKLTEGDSLHHIICPMTAVNQGIISGDSFFLNGVDAMLDHTESTLFVTKSIRNLLFDGYEEEILNTAKEMGIHVPYDKFGWFYPKNNSHDGEYTIFTGKTDFNKYGYVDLWKGSSLLSARHAPCNKIQGTAGDMWPPFRNDKSKKLSLFVADICSTLELSYLGNVNVNEIESHRYWLDHTALDNGKYEEQHACLCTHSCMPPGALDIETCQYGTPAVVSFPHFLYADQHYLDKIDGLKPDPEKHMFIIDLEPKLGIPVNVDAKLQINVAIPNCDEIENIDLPEEKIYYPIFWFSESASINLETAEKLKFVTKMLPQYVTIGCFLSVSFGIIILLLAIHRSCRRSRQKPKKHMVYTAVKVIPLNELKKGVDP